MGEILNLLARADPVSICVVLGVYFGIDRRLRKLEANNGYVRAKMEELLRAHEMQGVSHGSQTSFRSSA